ncbi:hypothetical protein [uncultured Roseivirga sp.]|uniref:hypothetical protein n=1 Tax=uncultured Roseivirga sp. TaxID=543088 RepID=UPI0030D6D0BD
MSKAPLISKSTIVSVNIEKVWELITTTSKFHALGFPGSYPSQFDRTNANQGMEIQSGSLNGTPKNSYIVEWAMPYLFSFGPSPDDWSYKYRLNKLDEKTTEIEFSRRFRGMSRLEKIFSSKEENDLEALVDRTTSQISQACQNLSKGLPDGLWTE